MPKEIDQKDQKYVDMENELAYLEDENEELRDKIDYLEHVLEDAKFNLCYPCANLLKINK